MLISKTFRLPCKCRWIHSACQHRSKSFLRNGLVDLHKSAYSAGSLKLTNGSAYLDTNTLPAAEGFDASHIGITNIKLDVDSAYYAGNDIYANIRDFNLKERSDWKLFQQKENWYRMPRH